MEGATWSGSVDRAEPSVGLLELGAAQILEPGFPAALEAQEGDVVADVSEVGPGIA